VQLLDDTFCHHRNTLALRPSRSGAAIGKSRRRYPQSTSFYRFDPSGVAKAETMSAFDEAMAAMVIRLNRFPIVNCPWHLTSLLVHDANRVALTECFQQVRARRKQK